MTTMKGRKYEKKWLWPNLSITPIFGRNKGNYNTSVSIGVGFPAETGTKYIFHTRLRHYCLKQLALSK
jgi:hypothetical protein